MRKALIVCILCAIVLVGLVACMLNFYAPLVKVVLTVRDEAGQPIAGAEACAYDTLGGFGGRIGVTDSDGVFVCRYPSYFGAPQVWASKEGFYENGHKGYSTTGSKFFRREPWPVIADVVLVKRGVPVPLIVRRKPFRFPEFGKPFGLDLVAGDWVAPHGRGTNADLVVQLSVLPQEPIQWRLTVTFPRDDGLVLRSVPLNGRSEICLPGLAPSEGYQPEWAWQCEPKTVPRLTDRWREEHYYLRIRSGTHRPLHGKIYDGITFLVFEDNGATVGDVRLTYYLNPDGTRNTEWDKSTNLATETNNWVEFRP
jgi:hypothetical protein